MKRVLKSLPIDSVGQENWERLSSCFERAAGDEGGSYHRKRHNFCVLLSSQSMCLDLSDAFGWCQRSNMLQDNRAVGKWACSAFIGTPLVQCLAVAGALTNKKECERLLFVSSGTTVQLHAWRKEHCSKEPILIGLTLATLNRCMNFPCESHSFKLKACSRCYRNSGVRVLYCSKNCQLRDFARHKKACLHDWPSYIEL